MQFARVGDLEVVTRITGPTHHFLGLALSTEAEPSTPILERATLGTSEITIEPIGVGDDLRREVVEAVSAANQRLGTHFTVTKIRYCEDDAPVSGIYGHLAGSLVEHVARGRKTMGAGTPRSNDSLIEMNP